MQPADGNGHLDCVALAFQLVFLIILLCLFALFPESPRWLAKVGREDDARRVLAVLRTEDGDVDDARVCEEMFSVSPFISKRCNAATTEPRSLCNFFPTCSLF